MFRATETRVNFPRWNTIWPSVGARRSLWMCLTTTAGSRPSRCSRKRETNSYSSYVNEIGCVFCLVKFFLFPFFLRLRLEETQIKGRRAANGKDKRERINFRHKKYQFLTFFLFVVVVWLGCRQRKRHKRNALKTKGNAITINFRPCSTSTSGDDAFPVLSPGRAYDCKLWLNNWIDDLFPKVYTSTVNQRIAPQCTNTEKTHWNRNNKNERKTGDDKIIFHKWINRTHWNSNTHHEVSERKIGGDGTNTPTTTRKMQCNRSEYTQKTLKIRRHSNRLHGHLLSLNALIYRRQ